MQNTISEQTRITPSSSSLIDLFVTTRKDLVMKTGTFPLGITDHFLIYGTVRLKNKRPPPKIVNTRDYKHMNVDSFTADVESAPFHVSYIFDDMDGVLWAWNKLFKDICDNHAKPKTMKIRSNSLPWINSNTRLKMNKRFKLFKIAISTKESKAWEEYKLVRNEITSDIRTAKTNYFKNKVNEIKNTRDYWKLVNTATCSKTKQSTIGPLKRQDDTLATDDTEKANLINTYFSGIGEALSKELCNTQKINSLQCHSQTVPATNISDISISMELIEKKIKHLKPNKSAGVDNIPPKMTRLAGPALTQPLYDLFTFSKNSSALFATWKTTRLTPIYKKDDETDISNYRPIANLCTHSKLMESCISETILEHVKITDNQWAYRKGYSTELLLAFLTETWRKALDESLVVAAAFIDFRKAFDCVSHTILLNKLQHQFRVNGSLLSWLNSYLSNRKLYTVINGKSSNTETAKFGIPQGSVLGPLLFALYTNDMPPTVKSGFVYMYADDTTIYCIGKSVDEVVSTLNKALAELYNWCTSNSLTPHPTKCEGMLLQKGCFNGPLQTLLIGHHQIKWVTSTRLLGVTLDNKLNWNAHVHEVKMGFLNKLNLLRRSYFLPRNVLIDLYFKIILPSITYALPIWGSTSNSDNFDCLEKLHLRAARIIFKFPHDLTGSEVLKRTGWRPLSTTYKLSLMKLAYKIFNKMVPDCMDTILIRHFDHTNLRSRGENSVIVNRFNSSYMKNSIHYRGSVLWNRVLNIYNSSTGLKSFNNRLLKSAEFLSFNFKTTTNQCKPRHDDIYVYF